MTRTDTQDGRGQARGLPLAVIGVVFVVSRLAVLPLPSPATDVGIYARYAREHAAAAQLGVSFYEFHAREIERQAEQARAAGTLAAPIDEYKDVEYPPLALAVLRLPASLLGEGPSFELRYYWTFRAAMAVIDAALFFLVVVLVRRLFPTATGEETGARLLLYVASTLVVWHLLYDRMDLVLAALVLLSLALLTSRRHPGWSFAVLATAVLFKIVPVVLVPLWVVGAMPADRPLDFRRPRVLAGLAVRGSLLVGLIVAGFLLCYLWYGTGCLGFLTYHRARPLEIGSLPASIPLVLQLLGQPITVNYTYGSINVHSSLTPVLVALSPWVTGAVLLGATVLLVIHFQRLAGRSPIAAPPGATLANTHPLPVVGFTLLLLMLYIATNKVFSTQYLLWLAPLVALLPSGPGRQRLFAWTFLVVCVLSTILMPFLFLSDLLDPARPPPAHPLPLAIQQPTVRVAVLLVVRNLLFLGLVLALAGYLIPFRWSGRDPCRSG
jgi:hypothetical protein